jgi:hypothetical protein
VFLKAIILKRLQTLISNVSCMYVCACMCEYIYIIRHTGILTLYHRRMEITGITVERTVGENGERDSAVGVVLG